MLNSVSMTNKTPRTRSVSVEDQIGDMTVFEHRQVPISSWCGPRGHASDHERPDDRSTTSRPTSPRGNTQKPTRTQHARTATARDPTKAPTPVPRTPRPTIHIPPQAPPAPPPAARRETSTALSTRCTIFSAVWICEIFTVLRSICAPTHFKKPSNPPAARIRNSSPSWCEASVVELNEHEQVTRKSGAGHAFVVRAAQWRCDLIQMETVVKLRLFRSLSRHLFHP